MTLTLFQTFYPPEVTLKAKCYVVCLQPLCAIEPHSQKTALSPILFIDVYSQQDLLS